MMKLRARWVLALVWVMGTSCVQAHEPTEVMTGAFELSADSLVQTGVPQGELKGPFEFRSEIIAGTVRQYWIFVPAQYDPKEAASVLVFQDGHRATHPEGSLRVQNVLTNLIHEGAIPPTIGIFITPGDTREEFPQDLGWGNPNHRWQEYDVLTRDYGRFIIEEMLPLVAKDYHLTDDPDQRAIGGTSSGAICAFTVAWNNPDVFRKVISFIGSYVSIGSRPPEGDPTGAWSPGGQDYPAMIRRAPPKPIKVFFQDGSNDLDNPWGNWFLANQQMVAAIGFANRQADQVEAGEAKWNPYENATSPHVAGVRWQEKHVWTDGAHSDKHGGALLPDAIRWLWSTPAAK